jgi:type II secretory pathway pseudopilin PulG
MESLRVRPDHRVKARSAYTLIEVVLVVGLLLMISALTIPNFIRELERQQLPGSARQLRSLLTLVRANAAFDGKRYRLRFAAENETDLLLDSRQPIVEREDDPINDPESFFQVKAPWAIGTTILKGVRCIEVRPGRPTIERLQEIQETRDAIEDAIDDEEHPEEFFDPLRPPFYVEPDGTGEWATFVLTDAPIEYDIEDLEAGETEFTVIQVITEELTGLCWLQRPFYDEELDLFEEKGWPAVLRQDFLDPRMLNEDDVLELHEVRGRRRVKNDDGEDAGMVEEDGDVPQMGETGG